MAKKPSNVLYRLVGDGGGNLTCFVMDGIVCYEYNLFIVQRTKIRSTRSLPVAGGSSRSTPPTPKRTKRTAAGDGDDFSLLSRGGPLVLPYSTVRGGNRSADQGQGCLDEGTETSVDRDLQVGALGSNSSFSKSTTCAVKKSAVRSYWYPSSSNMRAVPFVPLRSGGGRTSKPSVGSTHLNSPIVSQI